MIAQEGILDEINKVVRYYFDAKEDYRLACKRAVDPQMRDTWDTLCKRRERFHHELQEAETQLGIEMSDNGNVMADFKRDWERIRGAIGGHGMEAALRLARESDRHAIVQIQKLVAVDLAEKLDATLRSHLDDLVDAVSKVDEALRKPDSAI